MVPCLGALDAVMLDAGGLVWTEAGFARLLASMRDDEGRILIDGLMDAVRPLSPPERSAIAAAPNEDDAIASALALGRREAVRSRLGDAITIPALNVRGLRAAAAVVRAVALKLPQKRQKRSLSSSCELQLRH